MNGFTVRKAASELGVSEHHIRRLIRGRHLSAAGKGPARRISGESLEKYQADSKKSGHFADMSVPMSVDKGYSRTVEQILKRLPALSSPQATARRLGIPQGQVDRLISTGGIPAIALGASRFVPARWLAKTLAEAYELAPGQIKSLTR